MKSKEAAEESACEIDVVFNWLENWISLPEEVKVLIIGKLNMLEVFRLGNVCKDFSGLWKGLRNLDFGEDVMKLIDERGFNFGDVTSRIVSASGLNGPVDSFDLCIVSKDEHYQEVGRWMEFLSKNHVKSLAIKNDRIFDHPTLPSDILKCTDLQHLSLTRFRLPPSGDFQGFSNLISLKLVKVTITLNQLQDILTKSPLLEKLHLHFSNFEDGSVVIDTCMLKTFHYESDHWEHRLCLQGKCSNLTVAHIYTDLEIPAGLPGKNKLYQFFNLMPDIEILTLTGDALITLCGDPEPTKEETKIFYENQGSVEISSSLLEFNMDMHAEYSELLMVKTMLRCCKAVDTVCLKNQLLYDSDKELSCIKRILGYPRPESTVVKFDLAWKHNRHLFNRQAGRFYWKSR